MRSATSSGRLVSDHLEAQVSGAGGHDHPITFETATHFGLKVSSELPAEFLDLMALYPQPVRRQPSVEYLPVRRRVEEIRRD